MSAEASPTKRRAAHPALVLALTGAGALLASMDQTVVVTALPDLFLDIDLPITELDRGAWVVTGYLLGFTAAMPIMGRIADIYGHSRVYLLAMLIFLVGSALVAVGQDLGWIVGARVVQAVGGGALIPVTIAIANDSLSDSRRGLGIGVVVALAETGAVLGPLWGGLILHLLDWRWIFWINLPIGFAIMTLVYLYVEKGTRRHMPVDLLGGVLLGGSLAFLALGLSGEGALPSGDGWRPGLLAGSGVFLALFIAWERRTTSPLLPLGLLRRLPLSAANLVNVAVGGALILALVNIPLMTDTVFGEAPLEGGLRLARLTVMIPVGAVIGAALYHFSGYRLPMALGLGLAALGFWLLSRWPLSIEDPRITLELMVGGLGFGIVITPITMAVLNNVRDHQKATASALVTTARMVGMIIGVSALSSWGHAHFQSLVGAVPFPTPGVNEASAAFQSRLASYETDVAGASLNFFHDMFFVAMIVCLAALVPAYFLGKRQRQSDESISFPRPKQ